MAPSRVVHIVEDLKIGGIEKVIAAIVLDLDKDKYRPEVWCLARGGAVADDLVNRGVPLKILHLSSYHNPFNVARLSRLISESRADILHLHGNFAGTFGRLSALLRRPPVVLYHVHSTHYDYGRRSIFIERFLSHFTDRLICISVAVQSFIVQEEGIPETKTCVIYNGVDSKFASSVGGDLLAKKAFWGINDNDTVITITASLRPIKGHSVLLEAFRRVLESGVNGKLLIVGDGPLKPEIQLTAERLGISKRVIFAGERTDVIDMLKMSHIFVLPSVGREGLGIALIEAMAAGLPLVGSRLGGIPEVIHDGVNGLLVTSGSADELASAIIRLARDASLREEMGRNGMRIFDEKFTQSGMLHRIESLYDKLLGRETHAV